MDPTTPCAACGVPVSIEELAQGLAVKVSGRLLCPLCLDHLPGDAKVMVNQMRALRGMAVTTYRYFSGRHPGLPLFTFTTANQVLAHRRKLVHGEAFETPPLPPPGSRPRMPSAAEAARGERSGWIMVAGVLILVVTGIVWLAVPSAAPAQPVAAEQPKPVAVAPTQPESPKPNPTKALNDLSQRLRSHPEEAQAIADEAELLRDALAPREIALRSRADQLVSDARAVIAARRPTPPPPPEPQQPIPPPAPVVVPTIPEPVVPEPVVIKPPIPEQPKPVLPIPPIAIQPPVPEVPVVTPPVKPETTEKPEKKPKPPKLAEAVDCEVVVFSPKGAKPLLEPGGLPRIKDLPWPWPSGVAIHVAALDTKVKPKRLAIELSLAGVAAAGGATVVIHPGKAGRSQLNASWTDGTITIGPMTLELGGMRWQSLAIPATGCEAIEQSQLRLRLEDVNDLGDQRPFLVAGASSRSEGTPMPSDHLPRIPLLLPPTMESADGWSTYLNALRKRVGKVVDDRQFTFAKAKVLMPFNGQGDRFRSSVRDELAALLRVNNLPKGNPDELPYGHADFQNPQVGWPTDSMADLNEHPILAFGWRAFAWGADDDLGRRLENLLNKMLTADRKLRRPALVPLLIIGDFDRASDKERDAIDRRWLEHGLRLAAAGVPVIDLRSAQSEPTTDQVQRAAAALLADGLRQLDWLLKR